MKKLAYTIILLAVAVVFALEGTFGIGLRKLTKPLASKEVTIAVLQGRELSSPELPFNITLQSFEAEYYSDSQIPKQFTSTLKIEGNEFITSVNHPCKFRNWRLYQYDYDNQHGKYSVLMCIKQSPVGWILVISALMAACGFLFTNFKAGRWRTVITAAALTVIITAVTLAGIGLKVLPPVLRSPFFIPHIMVYMVAYALITVSMFSPRSSGVASALLLIGLLLGSIWAKLAWGHFWQWDVKECWAAATWFISAAAYLQAKKESRTCFLLLSILAFLAMNMTWYGVNWLPGAASSLHIY